MAERLNDGQLRNLVTQVDEKLAELEERMRVTGVSWSYAQGDERSWGSGGMLNEILRVDSFRKGLMVALGEEEPIISLYSSEITFDLEKKV